MNVFDGGIGRVYGDWGYYLANFGWWWRLDSDGVPYEAICR
ncbi:hypothetical protein ACI3KW_20975 [Devosia sp. ZW T5_3]